MAFQKRPWPWANFPKVRQMAARFGPGPWEALLSVYLDHPVNSLTIVSSLLGSGS